MNVYDISNLISINSNGIIYFDSSRNRQFIDFHTCRSNWVKHVNESEDFTKCNEEPHIIITEDDTNCVGQRNSSVEKPYFEFFTVPPHIKFVIEPKHKAWGIFNKYLKCRYYHQFSNIQKQIIGSGWATFDLS